MKTFLAAAALTIIGAVTVQAAEIFTCGGLAYAMHDGKVERVCSAPVTTHRTKLGERSAIPRAAGEAPERSVLELRPGLRHTSRGTP